MTARRQKDTGFSHNEPLSNVESTSFESSLADLEKIVQQLEREDLTLDDALTHFERGINLVRVCDSHLNHARGRIMELLKGENAAFVEKLLGTSLESFLKEENHND